MQNNLTNRDTLSIKGLAILLIVLHNFFHLLYRITKENEMDFDPARFVSLVTHTLVNPSEWTHGFFTYFGHFGVQLFIFLSAYGLTRAHPNANDYRISFFSSRLKKIYPTFLLSAGLWLVLATTWDLALQQETLSTELKVLQARVWDASKVALGVHNLFPGHGYPLVGPWWFIPFILQFYLVWTLLGNMLANLPKGRMLCVALAGILLNYLITPLVEKNVGINMLYSPLGHLPEIALGVYCAKFGLVLNRVHICTALLVLVVSSLFAYAWPLHHISALVLLLGASSLTITYSTGIISRLLVLFGTYALPIFLVNGFLRLPFLKLSRSFDTWYIDLVAATAFVLITLGVAMAVSKAEQFVRAMSKKLTT